MPHTPGDWQMTQGSLGGTDVSCVEAESGVRMVVASVGGWNAEEVRANAHLIAAAPELLAACKLALRFSRGDSLSPQELVDFVDMLPAAIAKASPQAP